MDLKEYCSSLPSDKLAELAVKLCNKAYPIWKNYCETGSLTYRDTVVGLSHTITEKLLSDTLELCRYLLIYPNMFEGEQTILKEEFLEPITALQDDDWELPYPVQTVFYAFYNLLRGFKQQKNYYNNDLLHYVSVNQTVDALTTTGCMTFDEIKQLIYG